MSNDPRKIDPWEARERERERWNNPRRRRSSAASVPEPFTDSDRSLRENYLVIGLLVSLGILLLSGVPSLLPGTRLQLMQVGAMLILLLVGTSRIFLDNMWVALRRGPNPLIMLLLAWAGYQFFTVPYRSFASAELLRVVAGASAYLLAAYTLQSPRQVSYVITGLLGMGCGVALYDMSRSGNRAATGGIDVLFSVLGTHEHVGTFLLLLLPVALAFGLHPGIEEKRRLAAVAASLVLGVSLLSSRSRSAWVGLAFGLLFMVVLFYRYVRSHDSERPKNRWQSLLGSPAFQILAAFLAFLSITNIAPHVLQRASILKAMDDASLQGRIELWRGAGLMATERPLTGWGLGSFTVLQSQWTHTGDDIPIVLAEGTSHDNNAHNYYLQWFSETGVVGLGLQIAIWVVTLLSLLQGVARAKTPFQVALLSGVCATVVAALVDMLASPMYQFHGVWSLLWTWMGLGIAGLRTPAKSGAETERSALLPTPLSFWGAALGAAVFVCAVALWWGNRPRWEGSRVPRGTLEILADPPGNVLPGSSVTWSAVFKDASGQRRGTTPGTRWTLQGDEAAVRRIDVQFKNQRPDLRDPKYREMTEAERATIPSVFQAIVPSSVPPNATVTAEAVYRDRYGRVYRAASTKKILAP